jgi:hypothetical protein
MHRLMQALTLQGIQIDHSILALPKKTDSRNKAVGFFQAHKETHSNTVMLTQRTTPRTKVKVRGFQVQE